MEHTPQHRPRRYVRDGAVIFPKGFMFMKNPLREDSPLIRVTARIADLITLNLLTILCSLPVFTIGASMAALFACVRDMARDVGGGTARQYFYHWKTCFAQATKLSLPLLAAAALLVLDAFLLSSCEGSSVWIAWAFYFSCAILVSGTSILCFLLYVNFDNTLFNTFVNAFKICIARLPQSILASALLGWPLILFLLSPTLFLFAFVLLLLIGVSLPAYWVTLLYQPLMRKLSSQE